MRPWRYLLTDTTDDAPSLVAEASLFFVQLDITNIFRAPSHNDSPEFIDVRLCIFFLRRNARLCLERLW